MDSKRLTSSEDLEFSYVMICVRTDELIIGSPGAVIRTCRHCQRSVWYNSIGDAKYGQGFAQFECNDCAAERYQREDRPTPGIMEATRHHLRSLGLSDQWIEDALFYMMLRLLGGKRRR